VYASSARHYPLLIAFLSEEQRDLGSGAIAAPITGGNVLVLTGFDPMHTALKNYGQIVGSGWAVGCSRSNSSVLLFAQGAG